MEKTPNGWPASKDPADIHIKSYKVPGSDIKLRVAEGAAPLLVGFAGEFDKHVENIDGKTLDDWGYAYRPIRGTTDKLSNHSSGTAIDLNSVKHPLGKENTFTKEQEVVIRNLCKKYGLKWGGDYKGRVDEMHFEVDLTPVEAKAFIAKHGLKV